MAWAAEASAQEDAGVEMTQAPIQFESPTDACNALGPKSIVANDRPRLLAAVSDRVQPPSIALNHSG